MITIYGCKGDEYVVDDCGIPEPHRQTTVKEKGVLCTILAETVSKDTIYVDSLTSVRVGMKVEIWRPGFTSPMAHPGIITDIHSTAMAIQLSCVTTCNIGDFLVDATWLDNINNPPHYTQGIECADYIESHEMDFFQGNAVKYLTRFKLKGTPLEDLQKAEWYVKRLIEQCKKELAKHEKK